MVSLELGSPATSTNVLQVRLFYKKRKNRTNEDIQMNKGLWLRESALADGDRYAMFNELGCGW